MKITERRLRGIIKEELEAKEGEGDSPEAKNKIIKGP